MIQKFQKFWTLDEEIKLKELSAQGLTKRQIAQALGRTYASVKEKLRQGRKVRKSVNQLSLKSDIPLGNPQAVASKFEIFNIVDPIITTDWLYDSHFPYNLNINPLLKYLRKRQPKIFGFGGDNWSLDVVSHWNQNKFNNIGMDNVVAAFNKESSQFKHHIGQFMEAMPNTKFIYIIGNHEDWLQQFCASFPQTHKPTLPNILEEHSKRIEFIPQGGFYQIGHLYFAHGDQFGSQNPAKQAVERTNKSIVFGHHHTFKVWPDYSMVDATEKHLGIQVPCFCGMAPEYGKGHPNSWLNGFFSACIKTKSGKFSPFVQMVGTKGNFMDKDGTEYF